MSASVSVAQQKALNAYSAEVIRACAMKYGFDGEEAMRELSVSYAPAEGKKSKAKKDSAPKAAPRSMPSIPLPFSGVVREDCCLGVKQNHGLYTQCFSAPGESGLCKGCAKQASKNASGEPDCGLISKRVMQGSEYRDAKGRAPVHYTKVMKKQKLTEEQVQAEAAKFGIEIEASHFAAPQAQQKRGRPKKATTTDTDSDSSSSAAEASGEKKARGRPKKAAKVVEVNATEDLFASLMQQAQSASPRPAAAGGGSAADEVSDVSSESGSSEAEESDSESKSSKKKTKKSKEASEEELAEKAAKFLAKEAEKEKKAALAQQKAAEKEAEKVKKAAEKEAEKAKKLAEKLAEKEAEKVKKLAEKEAEKAKKLLAKQEKEAEKQKKAAEKPQAPKKEKKTKKTEEPAKPQAKAEEPVADLESESESEDEAEEPVVAVKKFEHQGVTYLKSGDGVVYDVKSQEVVGKWNDTTKSIDVYDGASDSEEEEESDDEDDM